MGNPVEAIGKFKKAVERNQPADRKTRAWVIADRYGGELGEVLWYSPWRQYVFKPARDTVFNHECLFELQRFLQRTNAEHSAELRKRQEGIAPSRPYAAR